MDRSKVVPEEFFWEQMDPLLRSRGIRVAPVVLQWTCLPGMTSKTLVQPLDSDVLQLFLEHMQQNLTSHLAISVHSSLELVFAALDH